MLASVDITPVRRKFVVASNSIIAQSRGLAELIKSVCLPLLVYCIGALKLKRSMIQELSVCWNNACRRIFHFKEWDSVRVLQVNFGTLDFMHLYDLCRWKIVQAVSNDGVYWSQFVNIFGIQFHESLYIIDKYSDVRFSSCMYFSHCQSMC